MIGHCQKPTGHGTCGGELKEHLSAEGGKAFVHTVCVKCGKELSLSGGLVLKGTPPEQMSFPGFFPEQLELGL